MINSLLTFGAKSVKPEILEQTLTVRKETVNEIEKNCVNKILNSSTWQSLIISPRGSGKTHIVKVLYHRLKNNKKLSKKSVIAYMSEDEVGISNFTDLMVSILRAFVRYNEVGSETLETQISEASLIKDSNKREIFIKDILLKFANKRIIILLIENFDKILKYLGSQGQGSLRDFIHQYNNLSIIATSQNLIANLQDSKSSFYNFFNIFQLEKLDFEGTIRFLRAIAKTEGNKKLADDIKKPEFEGKLRAIYELTEGNHRLLVTFYSFLKAEFKTELSGIFIKVMNDLKPYYEQFVNVLPAQQQKIVKHLSLNRGAVIGKEIARACFIEPNVFSKQISLLFERGMIDKNKSGKDVFYELKEPLMRICFEISENPDGISRLFVDFLSTYYDRQIIKEQYLKFKYGARFQNKEIKNKYENEALMYGMALSEPEREKISFAHKVFDKIGSITELDSTILALDIIAIREKILSFENFREKFDVEPEQFSTLLVNSISLTIAEKNRVVNALGRLTKKQVQELVKIFEEEVTWFKSTDKLGANLYNKVVKQTIEGADNVLNNLEILLQLSKSPDFQTNYYLILIIGEIYGKMKQYEEAIKSYIKAIEINPEKDEAYYKMGNAYDDLKQYEEAIKSYKKAIEIKPENDLAYYNMGNAYNDLKQYEEAIKSYQKAIEINPEKDAAYYNMGNAYGNLKQYEEAIKSYQRAIEINPDDDSAYYNMGIAYDKLKQYEKAIKNYQKTIEINPKKDAAYFNMGIAYGNLRQYEEAIKGYQKAVEIKPDDDSAYNNMGIAYDNLKQFEEAIKGYQKAVEIKPDDDSAYNNMGIAYDNLKQFEEAIKSYQKAIEINPYNNAAYYNMGIAYDNLKQFEEAIKSYQKAIEIKPENDWAYNNMGNAYRNLKQYKEAIKSYQKAIEIIPEKDEAYYNMGIAYYNLKQYEEAIKSYQKVIEINPDDDSIYNSLGLMFLKVDKTENAFETFHKGLEINPGNKYTNFSLLGAYVRINDQNKSKELMINLINKVENDLLTIFLTVDVFYNLFRFGSDAFIKFYFDFLLKLMLKKKKESQLWKALPDSLFDILINIKDYDKERLDNIEKALTELLAEHEESIIPLKMFSIGVTYLKNKDKNAIFKLSKEERKLFKEAILDKIGGY